MSIASRCLVALAVAAIPAAAATCESLASLNLPDATITSAQTVAVGAFVPPGNGRGAEVYKNLPAFCRVAAILKPTSDSDIKIEVWLPISGWNSKYQAVGNGGWAGILSYPEMAEALRAGYATASTDTGHAGGIRQVRARSSRKADRFRLAFRTRNDRQVESRHSGVLQRRAAALLLERLLHRRPSRPQAGPEIPQRL